MHFCIFLHLVNCLVHFRFLRLFSSSSLIFYLRLSFVLFKELGIFDVLLFLFYYYRVALGAFNTLWMWLVKFGFLLL